MSKPNIICLTPVKNEAWILHRFLKCASLWADYIVIADQNSNDGSREIARSYPKVILIDNPSPTFNEPQRQKILIEAAREIPEPRLLITLDADEFLTSNFMNSPEWNTVLQASPGTVIKFQRAELQPDLLSYWLVERDMDWGFMDDGSEHNGRKIHSPRIPIPTQVPTITLRDIKVLHYQCANWKRMKSKHRWYQCWEKINQPERRAIDIYRQYHFMEIVDREKICSLPKEWLSGYEQKGIDMTSIYHESVCWWDLEVIDWLKKYGSETFKQLDIWDVDWSELSKDIAPGLWQDTYFDPRSWFDRYVQRWLRKTQLIRDRQDIRFIEKILRLMGW